MQKINFQNYPNTSTPINSTNLNQLQTNIENEIGDLSNLDTDVKTNVVNAINSLYFKENEELELDAYMPCPGFLTGGNKLLVFSVVMPKSLKNINSIAISGNLYIDIRKPTGGYIASNVDFNTSSYTISITKITNNTVRLSIASSTNFDSVNNQPLVGDIHAGTTFVFS